ncbi:MAG: alanine--tRNA ligase [Dissulfuribacterales bacterium]
MRYLAGAEIRRLFLEYFASKGHEIVPSSALTPINDPTLLFTNAGMVQFKRVFQGEEKRHYSRATTCQKCVRAGGKHNDLENVGYTARHHTFFEMLGNFSFGDYFKKEAIAFAWEFLTEVIGLPKERLWVTVFQDDDEAATLWPAITGIPAERVVRLGEKDNFWAMGDTGPCGPCSEILIDQGEDVGCKRPDCRVGCDCDRFLELWNLVFMQFFRSQEGFLTLLPKQSIDTGMGLERITAVVQGKHSNFDTDLFAAPIDAIARLCNKQYGMDSKVDVAMRVIADHARTTAFLGIEGIVPSNEGRGYVLRRIMRRAIRYGRELGLHQPFLARVIQAVIDDMGTVYPELIQESAGLDQIVTREEIRFGETLDFGLNLLQERLEDFRKNRIISGEFAFKLYDTYGFPIDILQDVAKEEGLVLDSVGFEKAMQKQRERSKKKQKFSSISPQTSSMQFLKEIPATVFLGYDYLNIESQIIAIMNSNGQRVDRLNAGDKGIIVTVATPFYAESGGQQGDTGIISHRNDKASVIDTTRIYNHTLHHVLVIEGSLGLNEMVWLIVNESERHDTARNHTSTHLLHAALRNILGPHVKQAGSLVSPSRLRFDFNHFSQLSAKELREIEDEVNASIRRNLDVQTSIVPYKDAIQQGATALFGEKYGDMVRIVQAGDISKELCGGTHVKRTGDIGFFKVTAEASVASGVRRIEAVTGRNAIAWLHSMEDMLHKAACALKAPISEVTDRIERLKERIKDLEKKQSASASKEIGHEIENALKNMPQIHGINLLSVEVQGADPRVLRALVDRFRERIGTGVAALGARADDKAFLTVFVSKDLTERLKAGDIICSMAEVIGGKGGGRPDMAQAGGPLKDRLPEALGKLEDIVRRAL